MAEVGGAALGAAASLGAAAYAATSSFSARHDQCHDTQAAETRRLVEEFEKAYRSGDIAEEDYEKFVEKKDVAITSAKDYRDSISKFKDISSLNIAGKWGKRKEVRKKKRQVRSANHDLQDHYYDAISSSSDTSSVAATSGTPPGSGLEEENIREWRDGVTANTSNWPSEDRENYVKGGYHPVEIGETFSNGRYIVLSELDWDNSSTMWLANDQEMNRRVRLKVVKSASRYAKDAVHEIELFQRLIASPPLHAVPTPASDDDPLQPSASAHPGRSHIIAFLDHFLQQGPNGTHVCMAFEPFCDNLLGLLKHHSNGVPVNLVKQIAKQLLLGLDYMHRCCGVIHTDLKLENILISISDKGLGEDAKQVKPPDGPQGSRPLISSEKDMVVPQTATNAGVGEGSKPIAPADRQSKNSFGFLISSTDAITIKITNLIYGTWVQHHSTKSIQTRQYRCPEVILGAQWGPSADIWSVACILFELITGEYLFDPAPAPNGGLFTKDDDHIAQIMELLGDFPTNMTFSGKYSDEFFNQQGRLRRINKLNYWPLEDVLHDKYLFSKPDAAALTLFLTPMLRLHPDERAKAVELVHHEWLEDIVKDPMKPVDENALNRQDADKLDDVPEQPNPPPSLLRETKRSDVPIDSD